MLLSHIYIGTSGWDYEDWINVFYETDRNLFSQYARVFNTVEINSTFYSLPQKGFIEGLTRNAPKGFVFSLKLYREFTHKKLLNPKLLGESFNLFFNLISPLNERGKLGAILIQLPPKRREDIPWFKDFLEMLPKKYRYAIEFRDSTWLADDVYRLLRDFNIAYTIVDEPLLPPNIILTADFTYIRWHGRSQRPWYYYHYNLDELKDWAQKVNRIAEEVPLLLGYFNNHFRGFAPHNALQMLALLGMLDREKRQLLIKMDKYFSSIPRETIEEAQRAVSKGSIEGILKALAGEKRFERGMEISNDMVSYRIEGSRIYGKVKEYSIAIGVSERYIEHNCEDWRKSVEGKRFCKHMVKFFLTIPKDLSLQILEDIISNLEDWEFVAGNVESEGSTRNRPS